MSKKRSKNRGRQGSEAPSPSVTPPPADVEGVAVEQRPGPSAVKTLPPPVNSPLAQAVLDHPSQLENTRPIPGVIVPTPAAPLESTSDWPSTPGVAPPSSKRGSFSELAKRSFFDAGKAPSIPPAARSQETTKPAGMIPAIPGQSPATAEDVHVSERAKSWPPPATDGASSEASRTGANPPATASAEPEARQPEAKAAPNEEPQPEAKQPEAQAAPNEEPQPEAKQPEAEAAPNEEPQPEAKQPEAKAAPKEEPQPEAKQPELRSTPSSVSDEGPAPGPKPKAEDKKQRKGKKDKKPDLATSDHHEIHEAFFQRGELVEKEHLEAHATVPRDHDLESSQSRPAPIVITPEMRERKRKLRRIVGLIVAGAAALLVAGGVKVAHDRKAKPSPEASIAAFQSSRPQPSYTAVVAPKATAPSAAATPQPSASVAAAPSAEPAASASASAEAAASAAPSASAVASASPASDIPEGVNAKKEAENLLNRGRYKDAIKYAQAAIERDPEDAMPYLLLGSALQSTGKWKEGIEAYSRCVHTAKKGPVHECRAVGGH